MIESIDGRVDFLTVTTSCGIETQKLTVLALRIAASLPASKPWRMLRYAGWMSKSPAGIGGVALGYCNHTKAIMQVWGELSNRWFLEAMRGMNAKITRVDYAVTLLFSEKQGGMAEMLEHLDQAKGMYTLVIPVNEQGGTLYVGSRQSEKFGRIYDKGAMLPDVPNRLYWRYEVEYKRSCALDAAQHIVNATRPDDRLKVIVGNVWEFFSKAGVEMPQLTMGKFGYPVVKYAVIARSFDKTLQWLETQVNPALVRLSEVGFGADAFKALGIEGTDCVTVRLNREVPEVLDLQDDF